MHETKYPPYPWRLREFIHGIGLIVTIVIFIVTTIVPNNLVVVVVVVVVIVVVVGPRRCIITHPTGPQIRIVQLSRLLCAP